jgi:hypothetical protein
MKSRQKKKAHEAKRTMQEAYLQPDPYVSGVRAEVWDQVNQIRQTLPDCTDISTGNQWRNQ